jgi:hypothetical protein
MSVAEISDLIISKSTYFEVTFDITNDDGTNAPLAGATSTAKIRKYPSSPTYASFTTSIDTSTSTITLTMAPEVTATLTPGRNYFDVLITKSSKPVKAIKGTIIVDETVS